MNLLQELIRSKLTRGGGEAVLIQKTITANGTFAAADDNADGFSSVTVEVPGGGGRYTLLASGSYTWAGGSTTLRIPISYSGNAKMYGVIVNEPLPDTAQMICACALFDDDIFPNVFSNPTGNAGFIYDWGRRADNSFVASAYSYANVGLSSEQMSFVQVSSTYPWRLNTYNWYIWGVAQ